jgi:hypothetical protein
MAPMIEPIQLLLVSSRSPLKIRLARKPPTNEPTMPSRMVAGMLMESLPGTTARAMKPAIAPRMIMPMMVPITGSSS